MVSSPMAEGLVYNIKLSSVGPGHVTGPNLSFEPGNMDLAMKLHYLRGIYYFGSKAFEGLTTLDIKEPMFLWLNQFPMTCGRFRRDESGRAYIKCNDCGVRFIEAKCDKTLDEWLEMKDATLEKLLVPNQFIGPELGFSPLVFIQLTRFKCEGTAVGLSWAHVLGDAFSAAEFMNILGQYVSGNQPGRPISQAYTQTKSKVLDDLAKAVDDPISIKRVGPVGDNWVNVSKCKMEAYSFNVTPKQLIQLQSKLCLDGTKFGPFEALSALIWQCIARIRGREFEPKVVTICQRGDHNKTYGILGNSQVIRVIKADFPIVEANTSKLAVLVKNVAGDEQKKIEEAMERDNALPDFIIYGANLTFVNLEEAKLYEFDYKGQKPVNVSYRIDGVGDEGAVLVLPRANEGGKNAGEGRSIMAILRENEIVALKHELEREGLMA